MRVCRNTPACSGGKEGCADSNCSQRGKFRVGKSPLGYRMPSGKARQKEGRVYGEQHAPHTWACAGIEHGPRARL